jgi:lysophospholipase L1-like esterase
MEQSILVFGDSIAYGAWDKEGGWVERLKNSLAEKRKSDSYYIIYNLSVSGETTEDLVQRFDFEAGQRADKDTAILFAIGINDLQFIEPMHDVVRTLKRFKENIEGLIQTASRLSKIVFFVGLTPLNEKITRPLPSDFANPYTNEHVKELNQVIKSVCSEEKAVFIEIFSGFMKAGHERLLEDGLHPNSNGHKLIFEQVRQALAKNKII